MLLSNKILTPWGFSLCISILAMSCTTYTPKPHGYPRFDFPKKSYVSFKSNAPYAFEIPSYAVMAQDTDRNTEPYWYNLNFPDFDVTVHLSYKPFDNQDQLDSLTEDAYHMAMKHDIKAEDIHETEIHDTARNNYGVLYDFYGKTATPFITDEREHYLRGALYFNQDNNNDSVSPVVDFLKSDLIHMIETVEWKSSEP